MWSALLTTPRPWVAGLFDTALLARDRAAKRRGVNRSAWVAFTLSEALDDEEPA